MGLLDQTTEPSAARAARDVLGPAGGGPARRELPSGVGWYPMTTPPPPPRAPRQDECPHPPPPDGGQRFRATTPLATFCGERAGVRFSAGVGYTDSVLAAADLRGMGYAVEDRQPAAGRARRA